MRRFVCRTAIPDILWSDNGPQFTSKLFCNFSQQCNGKIEATVVWPICKTVYNDKLGFATITTKVNSYLLSPWKRSLLPHGMAVHLMKTSSAVPWNTPSRKVTLSPAQKLSDLYKILHQFTGNHLLQTGRNQWMKLTFMKLGYSVRHRSTTINILDTFQTLG